MSAEPITNTERSDGLPAELDNAISGTKVIERNGAKYKLTYTLERLEEPEPEPTTTEVSSPQSEPEKKAPVLKKMNTIVDKNDPNVKYYVYKKTYTIETDDGPVTKEQTIRRKYIKHSPIISQREVATSSIINELLTSELKSKSALNLYNNHYLKLMKANHSGVKPYSYAAFLNRWIKALTDNSNDTSNDTLKSESS